MKPETQEQDHSGAARVAIKRFRETEAGRRAVWALPLVALWLVTAPVAPATAAEPCCGNGEGNGDSSAESTSGKFLPPTNAEIRLDRFFYDSGDSLSATVWVRDVALLRRDAMKIVVAGSDTLDAEALSLRPTGNPRVFSAEGLPVEVAGSEQSAKPNDGVLRLKPGEKFFAFYVLAHAAAAQRDGTTDPRRRTRDPLAGGEPDVVIPPGGTEEKEPEPLVVLADWAVLATGASLGPAVSVEPAIAVTDDEKEVPPGGKPVGTVMFKDGLPGQIATEEVMFRPWDQRQLDRFLAETSGEVVGTSGRRKSQNMANWYLIRFDPPQHDPQELRRMRALIGAEAPLLASKPEALDMYAFVLKAKLEGYMVSVNYRLQYMGEPSTADHTLEAAGSGYGEQIFIDGLAYPRYLLNLMGRDPNHDIEIPTGGDPGKFGAMVDPIFGVQEAWAYLALWDRDTPDHEIRAGVIDQGFAPNWDFRGYPAGIPQQDIEDGRTGPNAAVSPPTVGNSFFGDKTWHGNGVVTILGGVLNNGWGSAGVGGQVVRPMLYRMGKLSYAFETGEAIRKAVDEDASVINLSFGFPCVVITEVGSSNVCETGGRGVFCTESTLLAKALNAAACLAAPLLPIPGLCETLTAGAELFGIGCQVAAAYTELEGDFDEPMRAGVRYALDRGVPIVAIAGNDLSGNSICEWADCDKTNMLDWRIIPGDWPDVICVGATDEFWPFVNTDFWGDRVDLWAPKRQFYWHPESIDEVTPPEDQILSPKRLGGTSAAAPFVAGVVAMMQAVNPDLDRNSRSFTSEELREIPRTIRRLLIDSATPRANLPVGDPAQREQVARRRNLVNAFAAVQAANEHWPNPAWIPDVRLVEFGSDIPSGVDRARFLVGFDETGDPDADHDDAAHARELDVSQPAEFTGTILRIPRGPGPPRGGGVLFEDEDWIRLFAPEGGSQAYGGGRLILEILPPERFGDIRIDDRRGEYAGGRGIGLGGLHGLRGFDVALFEYRIPPLWPRDPGDRVNETNSVTWPIRGYGGGDGVYRVTLLPASPLAVEPDRFDRPDRNDTAGDATPLGRAEVATADNVIVIRPGRDETAWQQVDSRLFGEEDAREILLDNLNFDTPNDEDWFELTLPDWASRCGDCAPTLEISVEGEDAARLRVTVQGADGNEIPRRPGGTIPCRDYQGRTPLRIRVESTGIGPARYRLRISLRRPSADLCRAVRRVEDYGLRGDWVIGGPPLPEPGGTPWIIDVLRGSRTISFPPDRVQVADPSRQAGGEIARPQRFVFNWRDEGRFILQAEASGEPSLSVRLFDGSGRPVGLAATEDVLRAEFERAPPSTTETGLERPDYLFEAEPHEAGTTLSMAIPDLAPGPYILSVADARPGTSVFLSLPRGATHDGSLALEDRLPPERLAEFDSPTFRWAGPDALDSFPPDIGAGDQAGPIMPQRAETQLQLRVFSAGGDPIPIEEADIEIRSDDLLLGGESDGEGRFQVDLLTGQYEIVVRKNGYQPSQLDLRAASEVTTRDVYLTALTDEKRPADVGASPIEHGVSGVVLGRDAPGADYAPLADAELLWMSDESGHEHLAWTNHEGLFRLDLPPGSYRVVGRAPDYVSHAKQVEVTAETPRVVMRLNRVADPDQGLSTGMIPDLPDQIPTEKIADEPRTTEKPIAGSGSLSGLPIVPLPVETYVVKPAPESEFRYQGVPGVRTIWRRLSSSGVPGIGRAAEAISGRGGAVRVELPPGSYRVELRPESPDLLAADQVVAVARGSQLPYLTVNPRGAGPQPEPPKPGPHSAGPQPEPPKPGPHSAGPQPEPPKPGPHSAGPQPEPPKPDPTSVAVRGHVLVRSPRVPGGLAAVGRARLEWIDRGGVRRGTSTSDSGGRFSVDLPQGTYSVRIHAPEGYEDRMADVRVAPGIALQRFVLARSPTLVTGRTTPGPGPSGMGPSGPASEGSPPPGPPSPSPTAPLVIRVSSVAADRSSVRPLAGAQVSAIGGDGKRVTGQTMANGSVALTASPGTFRVQVTKDGYVPQSFAIAVSPRGEERSVLLKPRATPQRPGEPPAMMPLEVRVETIPGGEFGNEPVPIRGANVTVSAKGRQLSAGVTGQEGGFSARAPRGEVCTVRAEHPGYEPATRQVTAGRSGTTIIVLKARATPSEPTGPSKVELRLRVVDSTSNKPLGGVGVKLSRGSSTVAAAVRETTPGTYTLNLEPGTYRVQLSKAAYVSKTVNVVVGTRGPITQTVPLDFDLR